MKPHHLRHRNYHRITLFLTLSFIASATAAIHRLIGAESNPRRILHEPLFPVTSTPQPEEESPPPPDSSVLPNPDQPFLPESPSGPTPDQVQPAPPSPLLPANGTAVANSIASQSSKPAKKKVAIAISVGIVTLGMLSALAFYLYKHRAKHSGESQKLVGENSQRFRDESRMPPSTLLYIGTVEPSSRSSVGETNAANVSPYRKLSSSKRSDRYRPSPDLQPLPPLSKPPLPVLNSPPPMSSSDEESHETAFYTPQGSSVSNEEGSYAHGSRSRHPRNGNGLVTRAGAENHAKNGAHHPYSKRTSARSSRLSASSLDMKQTIIPSIKEPRLLSPPKQPTAALPSQAESQESRFRQSPQSSYNSNSPRRPKFPSLPPPPNLAHLQVVNSQPMHASKIPVSPPPPPPPPPPPAPPRPPLSAPRKLGGLETRICSISSQGLRKPQQSVILDSKANSRVEKIRMVEEANKGRSSSERTDADDTEELKPKLKPLHWDKVRATSDRITVWDQLKSSSFQLNEDMMETLFGCNSTNSVPKETTRKSVLPPVERENRVLDPKKSQNIAILLRALNVTQDEVTEALIDGNPDSLGAELLETLVKMAPTKEEEIKLRDYKSDVLKLGSAERFLKAVLDIPFAFKRVEAMLYRENFDTEVKYLRKSFETLEAASGELKNSPLFLKLLEAVLRTGNRMNVGTNRGDAKAFKLDTLLKLVDIRGTDGKTTLLHFVVQEIVRSEAEASDSTAEKLSNQINSKLEEDFRKQGLQVVAGLSRELGNVKLAAGMDSDVLSSYVSKLEIGLEKIRVDLQFQKPDAQGKFLESMEMFLKKAEEEIACIKSDERKVLSLVKEVTEYFHDNAAKEEAHPFRIFMIVRDFLSILDRVCKDVGKMNDSVMVGSARSFRIAATASLPVLNRYNVRQVSSDEESSTP